MAEKEPAPRFKQLEISDALIGLAKDEARAAEVKQKQLDHERASAKEDLAMVAEEISFHGPDPSLLRALREATEVVQQIDEEPGGGTSPEPRP